MALSETSVRNAKAGAKPAKLFDDRGLFLLIAPAGGKWWRFKYRIGGKEKLLSLGTYPDVTLKQARDRRDDARKLVADGIDPSASRQARKAATGDPESFEVVAREWFAKFAPGWVESHSSKIMRRFERDIFPWLGAKKAGTIEQLYRVLATEIESPKERDRFLASRPL